MIRRSWLSAIELTKNILIDKPRKTMTASFFSKLWPNDWLRQTLVTRQMHRDQRMVKVKPNEDQSRHERVDTTNRDARSSSCRARAAS